MTNGSESCENRPRKAPWQNQHAADVLAGEDGWIAAYGQYQRAMLDSSSQVSLQNKIPSMPSISIIMPTYNGIWYIRDAISSILSQSLQDWELLIADDGSTDGTREYLGELTDPRIRVYFNQSNLGIFGNLNCLVSRCKAPTVQILCQDDTLYNEDSLSTLLDFWRELPGDTAFLRNNHGCACFSKMERLELSVLPSIIQPAQSDLYFLLFGCLPGNLSNVSFNRSVLIELGRFREDLPYAGDFEYWSRIGALAPWAISKMRTTNIRRHNGQASVTLNTQGELLAQLRVVLLEIIRRLSKSVKTPMLERLYVSIAYAAQHRSIGLRKFSRSKDWRYCRLVSEAFDSFPLGLGRFVGWLTFCLTAGGRVGVETMAKFIMQRR